MPLNVAVSGATGRMGREIARLVGQAEDLRLVGGIARSSYEPRDTIPLGYDQVESPETAGPVIEAADVVLDFSSPEQLVRLLRSQAGVLAGRALVVGTTGLGAAEFEELDRAAERSPVVAAANFSIGVNVLIALVERAAGLLSPEAYDVEVVEAHHRRKLDAPSGTALALGAAVARGRQVRLEAVRRDGRSGRGEAERPVGEIGFHAVRGGDVVGEHRVMFLGGRERLELAHVAQDRALFAEGALVAARWAARQPPGRYGLLQVLGL
jgi:4-hydroxy-tetrahydrodipicolinate reductase